MNVFLDSKEKRKPEALMALLEGREFSIDDLDVLTENAITDNYKQAMAWLKAVASSDVKEKSAKNAKRIMKLVLVGIAILGGIAMAILRGRFFDAALYSIGGSAFIFGMVAAALFGIIQIALSIAASRAVKEEVDVMMGLENDALPKLQNIRKASKDPTVIAKILEVEQLIKNGQMAPA